MQAKISSLILAQIAAGACLKDAIDAVLGAGTYAKIASDVYAALRS